MSEQLIHYSTREKNHWFIWEIHGNLDRTTSSEAAAEGEKLLQSSRKFAIDLSEVNYLSSAGVRVLLKLAQDAEENNIPFAIVSPTGGMVRKVLDVSRLDMFLSILSSSDALDES